MAVPNLLAVCVLLSVGRFLWASGGVAGISPEVVNLPGSVEDSASLNQTSVPANVEDIRPEDIVEEDIPDEVGETYSSSRLANTNGSKDDRDDDSSKANVKDDASVDKTDSSEKMPERISKFEYAWFGSADVFVLGDVHGDFQNMVMILYAAGLIEENGRWVGSSSLLIQQGDITDKGDDSRKVYGFLQRLKEDARAVGGDVLLLLGNHDVMNLCFQFDYASPAETASYGGLGKRIEHFSPIGFYGKFLRDLPLLLRVNNAVFVHAGILPMHAVLDFEELTNRFLSELANQCMQGPNPLAVTGAEGPLWTRKLALGPETDSCALLEQSLQILNVDFMVVGHTITESKTIQTKCQGKLILVDTGLSRAMANSPTILKLSKEQQTFEISYQIQKDSQGKFKLLPKSRPLTQIPNLKKKFKTYPNFTNLPDTPQQPTQSHTHQTEEENQNDQPTEEEKQTDIHEENLPTQTQNIQTHTKIQSPNNYSTTANNANFTKNDWGISENIVCSWPIMLAIGSCIVVILAVAKTYRSRIPPKAHNL